MKGEPSITYTCPVVIEDSLNGHSVWIFCGEILKASAWRLNSKSRYPTTRSNIRRSFSTHVQALHPSLDMRERSTWSDFICDLSASKPSIPSVRGV